MEKNPDVIRNRLAQATGTEHHWQVFPENDSCLITDGIKEMAEICGAFWLIINVFSWQNEKKVRDEPFQVWKLQFIREGGKSALLTCEDGNNKELARQEIDCTDFPLPEGITLYLDGGVLLLPSEY